MNVKVTKLNESFSLIEGDTSNLMKISDFYKVEREGQYFDPLVKRGFKSPYDFFTTGVDHKGQKALLIMNGLLQLHPVLSELIEPELSAFTEQEVIELLDSLKDVLPFTYYDYQYKGIVDILTGTEKSINRFQTGQGKSLIISTMVEFFRRKNMKGILLVPNINLLTQFHQDIKDYNLEELYNDVELIGGGRSVKNIDELTKTLTISTWQSMANYEGDLGVLDFVICDETHRFSQEVSSEIVQKTINAELKYGFTGTMPDDKSKTMTLLGLFGNLKTHIRTQELIELGLGTPININSIIIQYPPKIRDEIKKLKRFQSQFKYIREYEPRNEFITNLSLKLKGNTLVLFSMTDHGKDLYTRIFLEKYPEFKGREKEIKITGRNSYEFQKDYGVYFLNGEDDAKTREQTRKILEVPYKRITFENGSWIRVPEDLMTEMNLSINDIISIEELSKREIVLHSSEEISESKIKKIEDDEVLLISNYQILSTGINIRRLHNLVMASPLKSYTTISQSIGRLVRLHESKDEANVYDIVDDLGTRTFTGPFWKQYQERLAKSYNPENLPVTERVLKLS